MAKTGGSAFPTVEANCEEALGSSGMTLRDYFAANVKARYDFSQRYAEDMLGRPMPEYASQPHDNAQFWAEFRALMRGIEADAMLAERAK